MLINKEDDNCVMSNIVILHVGVSVFYLKKYKMVNHLNYHDSGNLFRISTIYFYNYRCRLDECVKRNKTEHVLR